LDKTKRLLSTQKGEDFVVEVVYNILLAMAAFQLLLAYYDLEMCWRKKN
jgi:hypothetical protein